ncbi:MAG: dynamin family protein [Pseudomonadota bacterium]|nr:dynamin family protein [Pseudomonadota bacterium]MDP1904626.1 dynamin family protein [Pseudomonadota bacterium]MDP2353271.1 dynamin family protein [Pseudomonadota bacterium]
MNYGLESGITRFRHRRDRLVKVVVAYRDWLEKHADVEPSLLLRLFDLTENLKKDRLMLAFVAEFSRGKTELINALFFSDFKQRLLPSDAGRTTMCPTEIFYDADTEPYIRLLPIETRFRDDSITTLKRMPVEWSTIRLDVADPNAMVSAMRKLAETKVVFKVEARALGLWDENDPNLGYMVKDQDRVEIPAWRYALINFPHPLLESGLAILDTPGLNAMGAEPELTISAIPNAHALLFLLATDTGVTQSDFEIWNKWVSKHASQHYAVLNKIDMLWDDIKTPEEIGRTIQRQIESTATQLNIPTANVMAISAQKALVGKIRGNDDLIKRSGIQALEVMLAREIIPSREKIMREAVVREVGPLLTEARDTAHNRLLAARQSLMDLHALSGKNQQIVGQMREKMLGDKQLYEETARNFNVTRKIVAQQGWELLTHLDDDRMDKIIEESMMAINDSWTTAGLIKGMHLLIRRIGAEFDHTNQQAGGIKQLLNAAYQRFHDVHGMERMDPPNLDLSRYRARLDELMVSTQEFCSDPLNIMLEKRFMVKKFYIALVTQARVVFQQVRLETETWLRLTLDPIVARIKEHKTQLEHRLENLNKVHTNLSSIQERSAAISRDMVGIKAQVDQIEEVAKEFSLLTGIAFRPLESSQQPAA